jgi:hypothetical protein
MRRAITILFTGIALTLVIALPAGASARPAGTLLRADAQPFTSFPVRYLCDGDGKGSCKSLKPGATVSNNGRVYGVGENAGAWRWYRVVIGYTDSATFAYPPLEHQMGNHKPVYVLALKSAPDYCNGDLSGKDVIMEFCESGTNSSEWWVLDTKNHYFVNIAASNSADNWEVLCNPGGGGQLTITTRDSCSTYHDQWAWS